MKSSRNKIKYNGIIFDSNEELEFYYYIEELKKNGFVNIFEYNTKSFTLSKPLTYKWIQKLKTKEIIKESTLLQAHVYTPDFYIEWNTKANEIFYLTLSSNKKLDKIPFIAQQYNEKIFSYIEIKPPFDYQNMTRLSVINRKWVMANFNIFVQTIIPSGKGNCLFAKTFVPQKALFTKKRKQRRVFKFEVRSLRDFLDTITIKNNMV